MDWVIELRQSFRHLLVPGTEVRVSFADREDTVGEVGREFNALAAELRGALPRGLSREQAHAVRNRLAGILAALYVLAAGGGLDDEQRGRLAETLQDAQKLDAALRANQH